MPPVVIDLGIVVLIVGITYALMSEGLWGAALACMNTLFAALIAFNFYEPLAALLSQNVSAMSGYADTLCLMVLFIVSLLLLRLTTESLAPTMVRFPMPVYHIGRILFAFAGACIAMSIVILAFHTSPVDKKMLGVVDYARKPPFGQGLDHKWLAFFQYTTGQTFAQYLGEDFRVDRTNVYRDSKLFDPAGRWLIDHQNARPYGEDFVPTPEVEPAAPAAAGAPGAPGAPGMPGP
jgi:uncharacterized membrane protein required for colicin V production